jgi:hypothetical protein
LYAWWGILRKRVWGRLLAVRAFQPSLGHLVPRKSFGAHRIHFDSVQQVIRIREKRHQLFLISTRCTPRTSTPSLENHGVCVVFCYNWDLPQEGQKPDVEASDALQNLHLFMDPSLATVIRSGWFFSYLFPKRTASSSSTTMGAKRAISPSGPPSGVITAHTTYIAA